MTESKQIDVLLYMMEDVREETLKGMEGLTKEQLFEPPVKGEYPLGAYLMHLGEVDLYWLGVLSENKVDISDELRARVYMGRWYDPSLEPAPPEEPLEIETYMNAITETRKLVTDYVRTIKDEELDKTVPLMGKEGEIQIPKKWIIYHLIEHEVHHRGQMFLLARMAGFKNYKVDKS